MSDGDVLPVVFLTLILALPVSMMLAIPSMGTEVPDEPISENQTWSETSEPYRILENLTVEAGYVLTIDQGVSVDVAPGKEILVNGTLLADGVSFSTDGEGYWTGITVQGGGYVLLENSQFNSMERGLRAVGASSELRVYNSSIDSMGYGTTVSSSAVAWVINCTHQAMGNVSVSGGDIHEGSWFIFDAIFNDGSGPALGIPLKLINYRQDIGVWTVFDSFDESGTSDPKTDINGKIPPIPFERFMHRSRPDSRNCKLRLQMLYGTPGSSQSHIEEDIIYHENVLFTWVIDIIPPPMPSNLSVLDKGGDQITVGWDQDIVPEDLARYDLDYKEASQSDEEYVILVIGADRRNHTITGLNEKTLYDIRISNKDKHSNPSGYLGPIQVMTLDITPPEVPEDFRIVGFGGTWAHLEWTRSDSLDTAGYNIYINDTDGNRSLHSSLSGRFTREINITSLVSDVKYDFWIATFDDAEVPNLSEIVGPVSIRTEDIIPPVKPSIYFLPVDKEQYIEGSGFYNNSMVGLGGTVEGENRTYVDVYVDGVIYENEPRFTTTQGIFWMFNMPYFILELEEGEHEITARSIDPEGNIGPLSDPLILTIDLTGPAISFPEGHPNNMMVDEGLLFDLVAEVEDEIGVDSITWSYEVDGKTIQLSGGNVSLSLDIGDYEFSLVVIDIAGNRNQTSFTIRSVVPDHEPPMILSSTVEDGAVDVVLDPMITLTLNEEVLWNAMDYRLIEHLVLEDLEVPLLYEFDKGSLSISFTPEESLTGNVSYTLMIEGLTDLRGNVFPLFELEFRTLDTLTIDTDGDGIPDLIEIQYAFLDPSDPSDGDEDWDNDGLSNSLEYSIGTKMDVKDTDGDGMPDGWEYFHGLDPKNRADAMMDLDGDSYTNLEEWEANTDPTDKNDRPGGGSEEAGGLWLLILIMALIVVVISLAAAFLIVKMRPDEKKEELEEEPASEEEVDEGGLERMTNCLDCGAALEETMEYCPECGKVLPAPEIEDLADESVMDEELADDGSINGELTKEETINGIPGLNGSVTPPDIKEQVDGDDHADEVNMMDIPEPPGTDR